MLQQLRRQPVIGAPASRPRRSALVCKATASDHGKSLKHAVMAGIVAGAMLFGSADPSFAAARSGGRVSSNGFAARKSARVER